MNSGTEEKPFRPIPRIVSNSREESSLSDIQKETPEEKSRREKIEFYQDESNRFAKEAISHIEADLWDSAAGYLERALENRRKWVSLSSLS
jgi:hypothetical protein